MNVEKAQLDTDLNLPLLDSTIRDGVQLIQVGETQLRLEAPPSVWLPHDPTLQFLRALESSNIRSIFQGKRVLDIGTGTGALGIWALKAGASYVAMTDINPDALKATVSNVRLNGLDNGEYQYAAILSDAFIGIQEQFDIILANPPVQPIMTGAHANNVASKFNENSEDGKYVRNRILRQGGRFADEIFMLTSSRADFVNTGKEIDQHWGQWEILFEKEYDIDPDYHGPYMDYWIEKQNMDGNLRVYLLDEEGNRHSLQFYDRDRQWKHRTVLIHATK